MADKNTLSQMLESLVNGEQQQAEELFHEYVVAKSREIYESLIESEMEEKDEDDEDVEEGFEDVALEAGDEFGDEEGPEEFGADATDDLESEIDADQEEMSGEEDEGEIMQDLRDIIDELQAKFDALEASEEEQGEFDSEEDEFGGDEMGDEFGSDEGEEEVKDDFDLETVREYVEQVGGKTYDKFGKMGDNGANTKSIVAGKNDMGGTTANIAKGGTEKSPVEANKGQLKGNGLLKGTPKEDNAGNINVPGGKAGNAFTKKEPGHGAEKKGAAENAESKQSLFRGRR